MGDNYSQLVSRIAVSSGLVVEDIERKIEAKRAKLSGLVSKEGAAQIVAAELGINFDQERMKISELVQGMRRANVLGKVIDIFPVRAFNKNGREGKVCSFVLADGSSNIRTVLWDTNHISLIEEGKIRKDDVIEISNAGFRNGELHLSSFSDLKKSKELLPNVVTRKLFSEKKLKDVKSGDIFKTRAVIVHIFEPRYFEVCSVCGKKAIEGRCVEHGEIEAKKRALLSIVLDDGTATMRSVLFGEHISKLGFADEEIFSLEKFAMKKETLLGEEKFFSGSVRTNTAYNTNDFNIEDIMDVDPLELIKEFEEKMQ